MAAAPIPYAELKEITNNTWNTMAEGSILNENEMRKPYRPRERGADFNPEVGANGMGIHLARASTRFENPTVRRGLTHMETGQIDAVYRLDKAFESNNVPQPERQRALEYILEGLERTGFPRQGAEPSSHRPNLLALTKLKALGKNPLGPLPPELVRDVGSYLSRHGNKPVEDLIHKGALDVGVPHPMPATPEERARIIADEPNINRLGYSERQNRLAADRQAAKQNRRRDPPPGGEGPAAAGAGGPAGGRRKKTRSRRRRTGKRTARSKMFM
jgi:hypothetical protein